MDNSLTIIKKYLEDSYQLADKQRKMGEEINAVASQCIKTLESGGKLIFMGNGGSASDSLHLSAELVGRFQKDRRALPAISLSSNISVITAIANDYGYENIFVKQIEALGNENDLLIAISTSGLSENILRGLEFAVEKGIKTVGLTGKESIKMSKYCDIIINVPSTSAAMIQQSHITIGQLWCLLIEEHFFES
ncbi:SIS domain-containing protein [Acidimicrobiia bacterium]|nr:SIS domain-containing protein [Acidimicrobiia bacterium]